MRAVARLLIVAVVLASSPVWAQRRGGGRNYFPEFDRAENYQNVAYTGRFTMARIWYAYHNGWSFDYPDMERNFTLILREITTLRPVMDASNVLRLDDPELFKFPLVYVSEPGYWQPSDTEVDGLRKYMLKGGFVIFDDFMRNEWMNFEYQIRRVLPGVQLFRLDNTNQIFDSFYRIEDIALPYPPSGGGGFGLTAQIYGIFEDNDPQKRMLSIINYNVDIGDYMEWSGTGRNPFNMSNDAFKYVVNYIVYGMTH